MKKASLTPVLSYWAMSEKELIFELEELKKAGTKTIGAWVPWAHLEKDFSGSLERLVLLSIRINITPRLVISPELNTSYDPRVIPEHLLKDKENLARDRLGRTIYNFSPPNIHPLVDLSKEAVQESYENFLLLFSEKLKGLLNHQKNAKIDLIIGDSFFKHYQYQKQESNATYYEKAVCNKANEEYYFRSSAFLFFKLEFEEYGGVRVLNRSYSTPSCSPKRMLEESFNVDSSMNETFKRIREDSTQYDSIWFPDMERLDHKERNFLISSSVVLYKDIWINAKDYLNTSLNFRKKMQYMTNFFSKENLYRPVLTLVENRYQHSKLVQKIHARMDASLRICSFIQEISSSDLAQTKLLIIEKKIRSKDFMHLLEMTEKSQANIFTFREYLSQSSINNLKYLQGFHIKYKWEYEIFPLPTGRNLIIIDKKIKNDMDIELLIDKMLSVSDIKKICNYSEKSLFFTSTKNEEDKRILFFMNYTSKRMTTKISFPSKVAFTAANPQEPATSFHIDLPSYSLIPAEITLTIGDIKNV